MRYQRDERSQGCEAPVGRCGWSLRDERRIFRDVQASDSFVSAAWKLTPMGFTTAAVVAEQRGDIIQVTTGCKELDAILEGAHWRCTGSQSKSATDQSFRQLSLC